ncbi:hypothetical protein CQA81_30815, partial [Klebsiella pneumoniae]
AWRRAANAAVRDTVDRGAVLPDFQFGNQTVYLAAIMNAVYPAAVLSDGLIRDVRLHRVCCTPWPATVKAPRIFSKRVAWRRAANAAVRDTVDRGAVLPDFQFGNQTVY